MPPPPLAFDLDTPELLLRLLKLGLNSLRLFFIMPMISVMAAVSFSDVIGGVDAGIRRNRPRHRSRQPRGTAPPWDAGRRRCGPL